MQIIVHFLLDEVANVFVYAYTFRTHSERSELNLCLTFKHRLLNVYGNGGHKTISYITIFKVFAREFLYSACNMFLERALMSTSLGCMLSVNERVIFLTILIGVCECYLDILPLEMYYRVDTIVSHIIIEQIFKSVAAENTSTII